MTKSQLVTKLAEAGSVTRKQADDLLTVLTDMIVKTVKKDNAVAFELIDTYQNVEDPVKGCNLD